ncbi:MAG TPA: SdpI family protein [Chitinophagaceae bacterium]|nr:SdpI family protein [Chitinophagaceae bacterium]
MLIVLTMFNHFIHNSFFNGDILAGILFLIMGTLIRKNPPASMKAVFGYRTVLSTRNADTWKEGNLYAAHFSLRLSAILIPLGIFIGLIFRSQTRLFFFITAASVAISALLLLGNTEWHLTRTFDEQGKRKNAPEKLP